MTEKVGNQPKVLDKTRKKRKIWMCPNISLLKSYTNRLKLWHKSRILISCHVVMDGAIQYDAL